MALSDKQTQNVCLLHQGAKQCRYLEVKNWKTCKCLKLTGKRADIDKKVKETLEKMKKMGQDPELHGAPIGDGGNCSGYPYLEFVKLGYDVKPKQ